jgi:hypothetical protein
MCRVGESINCSECGEFKWEENSHRGLCNKCYRKYLKLKKVRKLTDFKTKLLGGNSLSEKPDKRVSSENEGDKK